MGQAANGYGVKRFDILHVLLLGQMAVDPNSKI